MNLKVEDLLKTLNLPLEQVMNLIESPEEALELARLVSSDSFFDHGRWFRNIIGDNEYETIGENVKTTDRLNIYEEIYIDLIRKKDKKKKFWFNQ